MSTISLLTIKYAIYKTGLNNDISNLIYHIYVKIIYRWILKSFVDCLPNYQRNKCVSYLGLYNVDNSWVFCSINYCINQADRIVRYAIGPTQSNSPYDYHYYYCDKHFIKCYGHAPNIKVIDNSSSK